jgi:hypothetical protein
MEFGLCEEAAKPCTSAGKPPGVIGTLSTTAGLEEKPGPKIYSGLPIREVVGGAFGPIECPPSNPLEITPVAALGAGGAFGVNTGNVNVSTKFGTLNFAPLPAGAEQYWEAYEKLGPSAFTPLGEVALKAEFANEFALAVEIKS